MSNLFSIRFYAVDLNTQKLTRTFHPQTFMVYSQAKDLCFSKGYTEPVEQAGLEFRHQNGNIAIIQRQAIIN